MCVFVCVWSTTALHTVNLWSSNKSRLEEILCAKRTRFRPSCGASFTGETHATQHNYFLYIYVFVSRHRVLRFPSVRFLRAIHKSIASLVLREDTQAVRFAWCVVSVWVWVIYLVASCALRFTWNVDSKSSATPHIASRCCCIEHSRRAYISMRALRIEWIVLHIYIYLYIYIFSVRACLVFGAGKLLYKFSGFTYTASGWLEHRTLHILSSSIPNWCCLLGDKWFIKRYARFENGSDLGLNINCE